MKKSGPAPIVLDKDKAQSLAACGATNEQIAAGLGVSTGTLFNCRKRDKALDAAIAQGKDKADLQVVGALYKKAMAGDTTACIFWLKNRRPTEWKDRHDLSGDLGNPGVERALYELSEKFLPDVKRPGEKTRSDDPK